MPAKKKSDCHYHENRYRRNIRIEQLTQRNTDHHLQWDCEEPWQPKQLPAFRILPILFRVVKFYRLDPAVFVLHNLLANYNRLLRTIRG